MHLVSERLNALNIPTVFSSSCEGLDFLRSKGLNCFEVPNLDVRWGGAGGFFNVKDPEGFPRFI